MKKLESMTEKEVIFLAFKEYCWWENMLKDTENIGEKEQAMYALWLRRYHELQCYWCELERETIENLRIKLTGH